MEEFLRTTYSKFRFAPYKETNDKNTITLPDSSSRMNNNLVTSSNFYTQTLSTFHRNTKYDTKGNWTSINKQKKQKQRIKSLDIDDIDEAQKLRTYYKTTIEDIDEYRYQKAHKKTFSEEEKKNKKKMLSKFQIKTKLNPLNIKQLPKIDDNSISIKISQPYFKTLKKANKILNVNKQIAYKINELTSCVQIDKYSSDIVNLENQNYYLNKMPKVKIKKVDIAHHMKIDVKDIKKKETTKSNRMSLGSYLKGGNLSRNMLMNPNRHSLDKIQITIAVTFLVKAYKPTSRSMFTINIINNNIYLFGGLNSNSNNDMWKFSIVDRSWVKIPSKEPPVPRYNHTAVTMGEEIVIYGGVCPFNYLKAPEEIVLFNTAIEIFSFPRIIGKTKPGSRKGHIALAVSQSMLVQGGYDNDKQTMVNTAYIYHLSKSAWTEFESFGEPLPFLMYHSAVVANDYAYCTLQPYSIYRLPADLPTNREKKKYEGIYIFGGINDKKKYCNDVYHIKICRKPCKVIKATIDGLPPCGRINCKMIYMLEYNMIVIHGGMAENQRILNDMMILNLEKMNWIRPLMEEDELDMERVLMSERTEHEMFSNMGKIFILGGRNSDNYLKMDFEIANFQISKIEEGY